MLAREINRHILPPCYLFILDSGGSVQHLVQLRESVDFVLHLCRHTGAVSVMVKTSQKQAFAESILVRTIANDTRFEKQLVILAPRGCLIPSGVTANNRTTQVALSSNQTDGVVLRGTSLQRLLFEERTA